MESGKRPLPGSIGMLLGRGEMIRMGCCLLGVLGVGGWRRVCWIQRIDCIEGVTKRVEGISRVRRGKG